MGGNVSYTQNVLICGIEGSGKSLFLKKIVELKKKNVENNKLEATLGYNYVYVEYANQNYHIWDLGGDSLSRQYWCSFYRNLEVNILIYMINVYDPEEKKIEAVKEFILLANEEELKLTQFFIIFNIKIGDSSKKMIFTDNDMKEATNTVDSIFAMIRNCQVQDLDNRVSYHICDVSKIKQGELSTTRLLNKCFLVPDEGENN
jgi:hypothetical protein